jgi:hypothetical protein
MFESVIAAMLRHKQIVFAAVAFTALIGVVTAPVQYAAAQDGDLGDNIRDLVGGILGGGGDEDEAAPEEEEAAGDTAGEDLLRNDQSNEQSNEQESEQEQEANPEATNNVDQSETNDQDISFETGDNTATVTQSNDAEQDVAAAADASGGGASAAAKAIDDDDGHDKKHKKHHSGSHDSDSVSASADADEIVTATATATGIQTQTNSAPVNQDSSIHDVTARNTATFGDDVAVPIISQDIDQDQTSDQAAANLAANLAANVDIDEEYGLRLVDRVLAGEEEDDNFPPGNPEVDVPFED